MLGGNGGPHFCRVRGEGVGVIKPPIQHSIEHELKRMFRCVRIRRAAIQTFFIVSDFFSRCKNYIKYDKFIEILNILNQLFRQISIII